jgi:hypothetical protein
MMLVPKRALGVCQSSARDVSRHLDIPLGSEFVHHLGTSDTIWETGEVLNLGYQLRLGSTV